VVDSDDLPLNVSRELLQDSKLTAAIRASCVKRALDLLEKIAGEDPEKYMSFLKECGSVLKEGLAEDFANRDKIAKLLRFASTTTSDAEPRVSFLDYIARMRPGQEAIYYLTADSYLTAKNSPHLEALRGKGVEVLLLHDRVDEWVISHLSEVEGKRLANIAKGDLDLSKIDHVDGSKAPEGRALENDLAARIKAVLGERVSEVRASLRLTESAACLVVNQYAMALHLQRLMKQAGQDLPNQSPILELNPEHPLLKRLSEAGGSDFDDLAWVLYDQAVLAEGAPLEDASAFVRRINSLIMSKAS
jgi:molecular chaperone HtpG